MRIIAGKFRNRMLKVGKQYRPSTDRVRETLFNILQTEIPDSVFLDAFAGSGAVGIEALSRGASLVYFLENHPKSIAILEQNLLQCGGAGSWKVLSVSVWKGLELVRQNSDHVDILFFDPPYDFRSYPDLLKLCSQLFPRGLYILETSTHAAYDVPQEIKLVKERKIGDTRLNFYRHQTEN